jgi:hypothetical protein
MTAISRNKVSIWIKPSGTAASTLVATDVISGEIKSYSKSGGERDVESDPVFGGFVDKEKPVSQVELSMEVIPSLETATRWESMAYALQGGVYVMSGDPSEKAIFIQAKDGTSYNSYAFNNCNVTALDVEHNADDNRTGTITFKFSPTDSAGISNFMTAASQITVLPAWTTLTA